MKKVVRLLLAILMVACLALTVTACKNECAKGNHDFSVLEKTDEATCTTPKTLRYKCANCDERHDVTEGKALGHDPAKTWTAEGNKHFHACTRCDAHLDEADHTPVKVDGTPATCVNTGLTDGSKCGVCNEVLTAQQTIQLAAHTYDEGVVTNQATCHTKGVKTFTCKVCPAGTAGHTKTEEIDFDTANHDGAQSYVADGATHKLVCGGCNATLESHEANMGGWTEAGGKHTRSCSQDGCTVKDVHNATFAETWSEADGKHFRACVDEDCTVRAADEHNANYSTSWSDEDGKHFHACMKEGCSMRKDVAEHNSDGVIEAVDATCEEYGSTAGKKCDVCDKVMQAPTQVEPLKHNHVYDNDETNDETHVGICTRCGDRINEGAHTWVWNTEDKDMHWKECSLCKRINGEKENHNYENGFACECGRVVTGVKFATFFKNNYERFDTLPEAVAHVTDSTEAVIYMGEDLSGNGVFVPSDRNITFRFNGHTYTVTGGAVGSANYETQAFHLEKNSVIKMMNGTITSKAGSGVRMLVQNYSNLTLENIVLDGRNLDEARDGKGNVVPNYTLSNNFGVTSMQGTTIHAKDANQVAFDVWYGMKTAYLDGVSVTVGDGCQINGVIEYGANVVPDSFANFKLVLHAGRVYNLRFSSDNVNCDNCNITLGGVTIEHNYVKQSTTDATCTEAQIDHYECAYCDKTDDRTVGEPKGHTLSSILTSENGQHYHKCTVCGKQADERVDCTYTQGEYEHNGDKHWQVCTVCDGKSALEEHTYGDWIVETDSTCTTEGSKKRVCTVCGFEEKATVELKPHEYQENWTSDVTEHWHKCANCDAKEGVAKHKYTANVCDICNRTITETEILAELAKLGNDAYLVSNTSTYKLTGIITEIKYTYTEYNGASVNIKVGNTVIYCFKMKGANVEALQRLAVGDTITVLGKLVNFKGTTLEFDQGCTLESITYGNVDITIEKDANATIIGLEETAERYSTVEFNVDFDADKYNLIVKINGVVIEPVNGKYSFVASSNTTVTVVLQDANVTHSHTTVGDKVLLDANTLGVTNSYNTSEKTAEIGGAIFGFVQCMSKNGIQMNVNRSPASSIYTKTALLGMKTISISYSSSTNTNFRLKIELADNADFANAKELGISGKMGETEFTVGDKSATFVRFTASGSNAGYVTITIVSEKECPNTTDFTEHPEQSPTCTEDGNIRYWTCDTCGAKFDDELHNHMITSIADDAHKATGHHLVAVERLEPTCTQDGYEAYWQCTNANCDCKFADAEGKTALEQVVVLPATGHEYSYTSNNDGTHNMACANDSAHNQVNVACAPEDASVWQHDADGHWQVCELCKAEINAGAHTFANGSCGVCGRPENVAPKDILWEVTVDGAEQETVTDFIPEAVDATTNSSFQFSIVIENKSDYIITVVNMFGDTEETLEPVNDVYTFSVDDGGNCITVTIVSKTSVTLSVEGDRANAAVGLADSATAADWVDNLAVPVGGSAFIKAVPNSGFEVTVTAAYEDGNVINVSSVSDGIYSIANLPKGSVTVIVKVSEEAIKVWNKVTDASVLHEGAQIVIVSKASNFALSTTQNGNNRGQESITKKDNTVTITDNVQVITLTKGKIDETWALAVGENQYLTAASSSSNYLRTATEIVENSSWKITVTSTGVAVQAQGNFTRNLLKYNSSSRIFSCYASGQGEIEIYMYS